MSLDCFHPAVASWFQKTFSMPTECQAGAWPTIQARQNTLIAAPTGSGKTFAAFLSAIDDLVRQGKSGPLPDETQVVYVSPLKALSNDIQRNLEQPLAAIREELAALQQPDVDIRTLVRTGDTPAATREAMRRRPPHIVVTTPESLYILLTSDGGRSMLRTTRTVIVDEIHAVAGSKRGSHLALSLERLEALTGPGLVRIGLSATQQPIDEVARFLVGNAAITADNVPDCAIIDIGHVRERDLAIEIPRSPLEAVMSQEVWSEIYDRLAELISQHRTTLIFVNTRRLAERLARHLSERLGEQHVTSHHGSLAREQRLSAEQRLKAGELRALVATASLELGIDIGEIDLVCQIGSTRAIATFLQRVGRSGHSLTGVPKGRLFPLSRDELTESAALLDSVRRGELDRLLIPEKSLDVLAQQVVAAVACEDWSEDALYERLHRAYPYRHLSRDEFATIVRTLAEGYNTGRGRRGAYVHRDAVNKRLRARRGARLTAITCGGTIPDNADYDVVLEPSGHLIGSLNEDFAIESLAGDIFQLGNASWRILRVEAGRVRVEDAAGQPPNIPFWFGEAPSRTTELSSALSRLRQEISKRLPITTSQSPHQDGGEPDWGGGKAVQWLVQNVGVSEAAATQIVEYLAAAQAALGVMPTQDHLVMERFFDETGGMQLVIHSPFGSRLNRAWGLALRKRFCRKFNFELQAAATEDAIVLSLGQTHSFPLSDVARYLHSASVRHALTQALLAAPMFTVRWRWNAACALAILRFSGGKRMPPQLQRIHAEDLISVVFPDQLACVENITGDREIPDHPLVTQTINDCLHEAMDIESLEQLLRDLEADIKPVHTRDLTEPSPLAQEILNARPYAFLDDAPLEERRTQAVISRRWLDPETAASLGTLDQQAIDRVKLEASPDAENADEAHDALLLLGVLTDQEGRRGTLTERAHAEAGEPEGVVGWQHFFYELANHRRAARVRTTKQDQWLWLAAERLPQIKALFPDITIEPDIAPPEDFAAQTWTREDALVELLRGRLEALGPTTATALVHPLGISQQDAEIALTRLEAEGFVLRGQFTPGTVETEWCERRLLARIHRYTINRLRREIEPVSAGDYMRFLFEWQRLGTEEQLEGPQALLSVVEQLEGFEAPAAAWEGDILPARLIDYGPDWLDALCLAGKVAWTRFTPPRNGQAGERNAGPVRSTPIALLLRKHLPAWGTLVQDSRQQAVRLSAAAARIADYLETRGASFFEELVRGTGLLRTQVEEALAELVAIGRVNADSFSGLRALLVPSNKRRPLSGRRRRGKVASFGIEDAGRWSMIPLPVTRSHEGGGKESATDAIEYIAQTLLRRYGVVCKRVLERETALPPWRELLRMYHRLEARGEIRGGRFIAGFSGEQFALPEAVGTLRELRRKGEPGGFISLSAADPLNLVGIITPGQRVPALSSNRVLYRDGAPIAVQVAGEVQLLEKLDAMEAWETRNALFRRNIPPPLRVYLE
ncbi:MAG: DEAD/DEAH box helicase [Acidiferrobacterales bacterium]